MRLDELIAALPEIGLTVYRMDQTEEGEWHVTLEEKQAQPYIILHGATRPTALEAMLEALRLHGIDAADEASEDRTYLLDLADRLFRLGTPATGTDGGDVDRLREIAKTV